MKMHANNNKMRNIYIFRFGWAKFPGLPYWPVKVIKKETVPQGDVYQVYVDSDNAL